MSKEEQIFEEMENQEPVKESIDMNFKVDEFEEILMKDFSMSDKSLAIKLSRNLTPTFKKWLINTVSEKRVCKISGKGSTRCIAKRTTILMHDFTYKAIEDCKIGDLVWSINLDTGKAEIKPIIETYDNGIREVYEVKMEGGESFKCTKEHNLLYAPKEVINYSEKNPKPYMWKPLSQLERGDYIACSNKFNYGNNNKINYNSFLLELLGITLADAYIKDQNCCKFSLKNQEKVNYIHRLVSQCKLDIILNESYPKHRREVLLFIRSKIKNSPNEYLILLKKWGLYGKCSYTKHIPKIIKNANENQIISFLSGLFNGDCWIDSKRGFGYSTMSKNLINDVTICLNKLGINYTYRERIPNYKYKDNKKHISYEINIGRQKEMLFLFNKFNWLEYRKHAFKKFFDNQKMIRPTSVIIPEIGNTKFKKIRKITKLSPEQTYDICVADNHNFCIQSNAIVRNSGKSYMMLAVALRVVKVYNSLCPPQEKRGFDVLRIVCGNQSEFLNGLKDALFSDVRVIDEKLFGESGDGSMQMAQQLKDIDNIVAKHNIHTFAITPRTFIENGSVIGLASWGRDSKNWLSRALVYDLRGAIPTLLGYVVIDIKPLYEEFGCKIYQKVGGCANPKRYYPKNEAELDGWYPTPPTNDMFPEELQKEHKKGCTNKLVMDGKSCPFYKMCHLPMAMYEKKKDTWIDKELEGGMSDRMKERIKTGLMVIPKVCILTDEDKIVFDSSNKNETELAIKMAIGMVSNIKYTGTETNEIITVIYSSVRNIEKMKGYAEIVKLDTDKILSEIPRM